MSTSGVITSWNPAAERLYGYAAEEIVGQPGEVLVPPVRRAKEAEILGLIVAGDEAERYRTDRVRRDGTVVTVSLTISPILDSTGAIVGAATVSRRASALQEAHDRFEAVVDQQRTEAQEAANRFEVRVDEQRTEAQDAADRFEERVDQERVNADNAQDQFQVRVEAERAEVDSDKDYLKRQLQQSQRLEVLGQLAGGVAHDFNNLLAVILNYAAFVAEELAGPRSDWEAAGRDVEQIQRAALRATALTHQLLAFARREIVQPRVLDLNTTVTEVQQLLHRTIGEDVVLRTELATDLWRIMADEGQLEQVLVNLAVNARDAMSGGGTLTIDTSNVTVDSDSAAVSPQPAGRYVRLRVSDTGAGMSDDVIEHVFEPFFTTKSDGTGTGLGLATVYGIVSQAEGTITVHSAPGTGTMFTIMIPATDEVAVPVEENISYRRTPLGETVLVVEDEEALREVTDRIFSRSGYHVLTAANGAEAITLAAEYDGDIHLLLTDVVMPNMLGKEVVEKVRAVRPDIEVLYMSGYAQPVLASQGRLDPDVNLIEKPFSASTLIEMTGRILDGHFRGFQTVETVDDAPSDNILPPPAELG